MKLKKEVKVILIHIAVLTVLILSAVILSKNEKEAYQKCMILNNNNKNMCENLLR